MLPPARLCAGMHFDTLESRVLFMVGTDGLDPGWLDPTPPTPGPVVKVNLDRKGTLTIIASKKADAIEVWDGSPVVVIANGRETSFDYRLVKRVKVELGAGNDWFNGDGVSQNLTVHGMGGNDHICGGEGDD